MKTITNFRDFGGYPTADGKRVKQGWLYRSGRLEDACKADINELHALKLKTIVDLRSASEQPHRIRKIPGAQRLQLPIDFDRVTRKRLQPYMLRTNVDAQIIAIINTAYGEMVADSTAQVRALFQLMRSASTYPLVIHCRAGKDRTGFICALIQLALGVESDVVIQDYLKSNEFFLPYVEHILRRVQRLSLGLFPVDNLRTVFTVREQYAHTVIAQLGKFGGAGHYLESCGITHKDLLLLKDLLLET